MRENKEEWQMSGYGTMNEGQQGAQQIKDEAMRKAGDAVEQAKQKSGEVVEQTRTRAFDMMDQQKSRAAEGLGGVASALRQTGESLRSGDQAQIGQFADRAADAVERFSDELRSKDMNELLYEAERFARREPELFLGGAVLLGLVAARFMKASSRRSMRGMQDYDRSRYEYGDRFSGYGATQYGSGQYDREIDYRTTGTGGYRTTGGYGASGAFGASGADAGIGAAWTGRDALDETDAMRSEHHHDIESDWTGEADAPARKADSSQA
ncbi:MAG: hypothetical protein MUC34_19740 [Anaerolineae bacterium]|jgi:hypothetical protein|nr:hypothetical protein [Anaerolineae bacterium]